ncbi:MAG: (Fe-S)-binding protein [Candidatus Helarchaeota archaeon]
MQEIEYDYKKEKRKVIPTLRKEVAKCTACGLCISNCVFHEYSKKDSRKIMKEIKEFLLSKNLDKKLSRKAKKYIWTCGICEHCMNHCPSSELLPRTPLILLLRAILVIKGEAPFIVRFARRFLFKDIKNPILKNLWPIVAKLFVDDWENDKDSMKIRIRKAIDKARKIPKKGAEICFSGGCGHTWAAPDVVYATISILEEAKEDFIVIGNPEYCCGMVYIVMGFLDLWLQQTYNLMQKYRELKPRPKNLLLHCPGCYTVHTFDLSKYGITLPLTYLREMQDPIKIMHVNEYNLQLIKEGKIELKHEIPLTVTYNDNCSLGRRMASSGRSVYDEPREILESIPGIKLVESDFTHENAFCCGLLSSKLLGFGTNLSGLIGKDPSYKTQKVLFKNLLDKGSSNLITPCMGCAVIFEDSARVWNKKLGKKINVFDVQELINLSIGKRIPNRQIFINNAFKLSLPYIKLPIVKVIPRIVKTQAFRDIFRFLKETISYMLKK